MCIISSVVCGMDAGLFKRNSSTRNDVNSYENIGGKTKMTQGSKKIKEIELNSNGHVLR